MRSPACFRPPLDEEPGLFEATLDEDSGLFRATLDEDSGLFQARPGVTGRFSEITSGSFRLHEIMVVQLRPLTDSCQSECKLNFHSVSVKKT
ncbi:hypothetical protein BV898_12120 [Hypsibius exemplaris]|uniref:Uncharacterized protein n=1 Tax=Hypsibius exemplaris TaxID=2072580 RepID=A0A1W0WEN1_HYPEX|nr:hypothetical protein BV898_12120 [Hypsibius exemplaris]